jgi:hypothetical protein
MTGSTPCSRSRLTARRDVVQPGLCHTVMLILPHILRVVIVRITTAGITTS